MPPKRASDDCDARPRHDDDFFIPFATFALILALTVIFVVQAATGQTSDTLLTLTRQATIAQGAVDGHLVFVSHEWWRLFTAPMLHGGLMHLVSNCIVLGLIGWYLEPLIGSEWLCAIFALSALGGSLGSLAQNDAQVASVGASGAISGLLAAALIVSAKLDDPKLRRRMRILAARVLVPAVLPVYFSASATHGHVDYGAHLGGAIAGVMVAVFLAATWDGQTRRPNFTRMAAVIAVSFGMAVVVAFGLTLTRAPAYAAADPARQLIPDREIPDSFSEAGKHAADWIARYPSDPRGYLFEGADLTFHHDAAGGVEQLRHALALYTANQDNFSPRLGTLIKLTLAYAIRQEGNLDAARDMARESCSADGAPETLLTALKQDGVCP